MPSAAQVTAWWQDLYFGRVTADRRREASEQLLLLLSGDDEWRDHVREITDDEDARAKLAEIGRLKAAGTVDETRAGRIGRAIIARYPKAAMQAGDGDA